MLPYTFAQSLKARYSFSLGICRILPRNGRPGGPGGRCFPFLRHETYIHASNKLETSVTAMLRSSTGILKTNKTSLQSYLCFAL